jgi:hypothetical protein
MPVSEADWPDLVDELDCWGTAGQVATLWWRDDDAATASAALDRQLSLAGAVPLALAVVPAAAERGLVAALGYSPQVFVLQHGWQHLSHAGSDKKTEFPATRPRAAVRTDLAAGRARLSALFAARALAVLAPPWNRFEDAFLPLLAEAGLGGISRKDARRARAPAARLVESNVHVDVVAWKGDRGFIGADAALGGLVGHLRRRRLGAADPQEPTGLLTHHLVQDAATDEFLSRLLAVIAEHPAARWLDAAEVFASA